MNYLHILYGVTSNNKTIIRANKGDEHLRWWGTWLILITIVLFFVFGLAISELSQPLIVHKIELPNWGIRMKLNHLQLMLSGDNLDGIPVYGS